MEKRSTSRYKLNFTSDFTKNYKKLVKNNKNLVERLDKVFILLIINPYHPGLRTHKVNTKELGIKFSSKVTGDLRLFWEFEKNLNIKIYFLGGHEVYK